MRRYFVAGVRGRSPLSGYADLYGNQSLDKPALQGVYCPCHEAEQEQRGSVCEYTKLGTVFALSLSLSLSLSHNTHRHLFLRGNSAQIPVQRALGRGKERGMNNWRMI